MNTIKDLNLKDKRVFLRADLNVPLESGKITNDFRLQKILPTINYILEHGGKVILATHIGRPKTNSEPELSTEMLVDWFKSKNYEIKFEGNLQNAIEQSTKNFSEILLLENLRFFDGEQTKDAHPTSLKLRRTNFAQQLAQLADIYINDAFAVMHRQDTSVTLLPLEFDKKNRAIGLLVEQELKELSKLKLSKLKKDPKKPFIVVIGGNKIATKIPLLESFVTQHVDTFIIGGAIANTFLKAQGFEIGTSLFEENELSTAQNFLEFSKQKNIPVLLPTDVRAIEPGNSYAVHNCDIRHIVKDANIVDIGTETEKFFAQTILKAQTVFANGTMGIYTQPEYAQGTKHILQAIAARDAYSVIGGGDAVAAAQQFGFEKDIDFLSTGGGATLAFLGAHEPLNELPGLRALQ